MKPNTRVSSLLGMVGLITGALTASPGLAAAAAVPGHTGTQTCTGTVDSPGTLAGTYGNVIIAGACVVNAGPADVTGNLIIAPGGALTAIFGLNDQTGSGNSNLIVHGNLTVGNGASLLLGCNSVIITTWSESGQLVSHPSNPCFDDPDPSAPTLTTHDVIDGNLVAEDPLGVVMQSSTVRGNVTQQGGGAGLSCIPVGVFQRYSGFPEYSDYENDLVYGNVNLSGLDTCWFGTHRNTVHGNMTVDDNVAGRDAMEVDTSTILGNLSCQDNSPAVELGDGNGSPDQVAGNATGQCGFDMLLANPAPGSGIDVPPTYQPVAVKLHH